MVFEFISIGPKGNIPKLIKYSATNLKDVYNLAFDDKNNNSGQIDDTIISNNGDSEKILATVVASLYGFTEKHTEAWINAIGSTKSRTRLYRIGITKYISEIERDFEIYGLIQDEWHEFTLNTEYDGFLTKRKTD